MLCLAMLFWIGKDLGAPTWYWWCWGILAFLDFVKFSWSMYKSGRDSL